MTHDKKTLPQFQLPHDITMAMKNDIFALRNGQNQKQWLLHLETLSLYLFK